MGRQFPIATVGLILANFSLAGLPLLAGFPIYLALWEELAGLGIWWSVASLLGSAGLLVAAIRSLAVLVMGPDELPEIDMGWQELGSYVLLTLGVAMMFVLGLFPQWLLPMLTSLSASFQTPVP